MKKEPNKKIVGLFLVVGFALFFWLIGQTIWHKLAMDNKNVFVMYFNESLQGLSEGAPVVFQGVEIGKVTRIKLVADTQDLKFQVPVYVKFKPMGELKQISAWNKLWRKDDLLEILIQHGLRARLVTQSYLTGQLMIEMVMQPDAPAGNIEKRGDSQFPQIPTILSKTEEIAKDFDNLQIRKTIMKIDHIVSVLDNELPVLLPALSNSAKNLDDTLAKIANETEGIISNLNKSLQDISNAAKSLGGNETVFNVNRTLQDISDAARSLQNLTDYLERHPESLIKGKKGE